MALPLSVVAEQDPFFIALSKNTSQGRSADTADLSTALRSGRDDKGEGGASMDGSCECRDGRALLAAEKLWLVRDEEKASLVGEALS